MPTSGCEGYSFHGAVELYFSIQLIGGVFTNQNSLDVATIKVSARRAVIVAAMAMMIEPKV
jgi:hypothetical protein